jgi:tryptophanyl-tRNA synthetase
VEQNITQRKRILTGDRPTARLHLGHYVGTLVNRVKLQREYDTYILIADIQALSTHWEQPEIMPDTIRQVALDYLAVGIDPEICNICVQSMIPQIAELTVIYGLFTRMNKLRHNPTLKTEAQQYGYMKGDDLIGGFDKLTYGFFGYPISQAADITFVRADLVPVGEDQVPHIELCRDIVGRFNQLYGRGEQIIPLPQALVGDVPRLAGLDGATKMSKSLGNAVFLSDDDQDIEKAVMKAITDPQKIRRGDPGRPEVCNIFAYHKVFTPEDEVQCIAEECRNGTLGCVADKKRLAEVLKQLIGPFRQKRSDWERRPHDVIDILRQGTADACVEGQKTLSLVRDAMSIGYW